jgi:hypothetical protein
MRKSSPLKIIFPRHCYLSFGSEPTKSCGMNYPSTIAHEFGTANTLGWFIKEAFLIAHGVTNQFAHGITLLRMLSEGK